MSKLIIVDDHPLYLEGARGALARLLPHVDVLVADSVRACFSQVALHPDVDLVLIDFHLPEIDGFDALKLFAITHPGIATVMISGEEPDAALVQRALDQGAAGFIPKSLAVAGMAAAIESVLAGNLYIPALPRDDPRRAVVDRDGGESAEGLPRQVPRVERDRIDVDLATRSLSLRQLEVLSLVGQGKSNKDIARTLDIAERTVKAHATRIFEVLGASNRTQAVLVAQRIGLLTD